jgi:hypothetical protein
MGVEFSTATAAAALETSSKEIDTSDAAFEEVFEALAVSALRFYTFSHITQHTVVCCAAHSSMLCSTQ